MADRLADRAEILDLMHAYAWAIDDLDLDALDDVFTADAFLDYSSNPGGAKGPYPEVRAWLADVLRYFPVTQHLMANTQVTLDGDRATARTMVYNPQGAATRKGPPHFFYVGARYDDELVRTAEGWKISQRVETFLYMDGTLPPELILPEDA
jgi:3-phenylpropionate/cinnamic acid dioxygenase small subunit